jgi:hypothetical protein
MGGRDRHRRREGQTRRAAFGIMAGVCVGIVGLSLAVAKLGIFQSTKVEKAPFRVPDNPTSDHTALRTSEAPAESFAGSARCRDCHERFYELWAPSFHGRAMQPFTAELARTHLTTQTEAVRIGKQSFRVELNPPSAGLRSEGLGGERFYPFEHALGGKNVFYFLTPQPRGRLQVLPLAYDVRRQEWFDTTASAVRHFRENPVEAISVLRTGLNQEFCTADLPAFLGKIYERAGNGPEALNVYRAAAANPSFSNPERQFFRVRVRALEGGK